MPLPLSLCAWEGGTALPGQHVCHTACCCSLLHAFTVSSDPSPYIYRLPSGYLLFTLSTPQQPAQLCLCFLPFGWQFDLKHLQLPCRIVKVMLETSRKDLPSKRHAEYPELEGPHLHLCYEVASFFFYSHSLKVVSSPLSMGFPQRGIP